MTKFFISLVLCLTVPSAVADPSTKNKKDPNPASAKQAEVKRAEDPNVILEKAEHIRNPPDEYVCKVTLNDRKNGVNGEPRTYETSVKDRERARVKFLTPTSEKGTKVLMRGQDMWVLTTSSANPIRISANQKLTGNAAYGDVARLGFIGNYTAVLLKEDKIDGKNAYVLDLTSKPDRPVTYDKVEYWIEKGTYRPLKSVYKTSSGKVIREGSYADFVEMLGVQRPATFVLVNSLQKDHVTTLKFSNTVKKSLPDLLFEKQNMNRD